MGRIFAKRTDANQSEIVKALRAIPGVEVEPNHDDILVGFGGQTYWYEIKTPECIRKDGKPKKGALKPSQEDLLRNWTGHYRVVWSVDQILEELGICIQ